MIQDNGNLQLRFLIDSYRAFEYIFIFQCLLKYFKVIAYCMILMSGIRFVTSAQVVLNCKECIAIQVSGVSKA